MDHSHRLVAASLALIFCSAAQAADPAPTPEAGAAATKAAAPAVKELPSRPFPKVLPPARSTPAVDKTADIPTDAPLDKNPAKQETAQDKFVVDKLDAYKDKPVDKLAAADVKRMRKPKPKAAAPADPAMKQVARDAVEADAHGQAGDRAPYIVQSRDTLDRVIKKTLPTTPFSPQILREAFMKANPQAFPAGRVQRLRAGQSLRIPDATVFRLIVLGETSAPVPGPVATSYSAVDTSGEQATSAGSPLFNQTVLTDSPKTASLQAMSTLPVLSPRLSGVPVNTASVTPATLSIPRKPADMATAVAPSASISPEEKQKWVRFP